MRDARAVMVRRRAPTEVPSSPRQVAVSLVALRPIINGVAEDRRAFVTGLGLLLESSRFGDAQASARDAGKLGREHIRVFQRARERLHELSVPPAVTACREAVDGWIEMHVAACEALAEVGASGDLGRLREAHSLLAEARRFARRFNQQYDALVSSLRATVTAARDTRRRR